MKYKYKFVEDDEIDVHENEVPDDYIDYEGLYGEEIRDLINDILNKNFDGDEIETTFDDGDGTLTGSAFGNNKSTAKEIKEKLAKLLKEKGIKAERIIVKKDSDNDDTAVQNGIEIEYLAYAVTVEFKYDYENEDDYVSQTEEEKRSKKGHEDEEE